MSDGTPFHDRVRRRAERVALRSLLRDLRRERGLTQQEVADCLGVAQAIVSNIESGERRIDFLELRHLLQTLDTPLSCFLDRLEARLTD